jgi:DnaJ family protein C protein 28
MTKREESNAPSEGRSRRRRRPGESWQSFVERQIQEAQEQGMFDNLPGHGEPLRLEAVNPYEGPNALAHKILKDHGFAPEWIELDKEIRQELEAARRQLANSFRRYTPDSDVWQRVVDRFAQQIAELNDKIGLYNLKAPAMQFHRRRIVLEDELRRVREGNDADD